MTSIFGLFFIFFIAALAFWIWALVDAIRVPDDSMYQAGNKLIWVLVIALAQFIGAVIYVAIGRPKAGAVPRQGPAAQIPPPPL